MLKVSILPLNSSRMVDFIPKFCIFGKKISDEQNISIQAKI